jgi:hypothetical protein
MSWLRRSPVFAATLLVLGLGVVAEAGFVVERRAASRAARKHLDQVSRELRTLETIQPAPTPGNTALIEADLARSAQILAALQTELRPTGDRAVRFFSAPAPAQRSEAFFDIAQFVEGLRIRARQAGIGLRPDERFGFSSYAHEAPETGQLAVVARERRMVEYLLEALLAAQPHQLLSVQRSRREGKTGAGATGTPVSQAGKGGPAGSGADYFEIDPRISARVPGLVDATAFRLSFTGHTDTLRALLARLAEFELPLLVRAVEVTPADRQPDGPTPGPTAATLLVASAWSRFTVTVEFIAPIPQPAAV